MAFNTSQGSGPSFGFLGSSHSFGNSTGNTFGMQGTAAGTPNSFSNNNPVFGGGTNTGGAPMFGQQPNQQGSGFSFGSSMAPNVNGFGQGTPSFGGGGFGGLSQAPTLAKPNGFFGNNTQPAGFGAPNTSFGATSNSASNFNTTPSFSSNFAKPQQGFGNGSFSQWSGGNKFQPVKALNQKLDSKHLVKCICLGDGNYGFSMKELRIRSLTQPLNQQGPPNSFGFGSFNTQSTSGMFGGNLAKPAPLVGNTPPVFGATPSPGFSFGSSLSNNNGQGFGAATTPSFGSTLNSSPFAGTSTFGSQQTSPNQSLLGNTVSTGAFTNPNTFSTPQTFAQQPSQFTGFNSMGQTVPGPNQTAGFFPGQHSTPGLFPQNTFPNGNAQVATSSSLQMAQNSFSLQSAQQVPSAFPGLDPGLVNTIKPIYMLANSLAQNSGIFNNTNPMEKAQTQAVFLNTLFNSQFFRNLISVKENSPYDELAKTFPKQENRTETSSLFGYGEEWQDSYSGYRSYSGSPARNKKIDFYRTPYIFSESAFDQRPKNNERLFQKFDPKPSRRTKSTIFGDEILKKTAVDEFQQCYDKVQKKTLKQITAKPADMPIRDNGYKLSPSLDRLSELTVAQLKKVSNVSIENQFGQIQFRQPVSLLRKKLSECIEIAQDSVEIFDPEWQGKRCVLVFRNFSNYTHAAEGEKSKIERKMRRWAEKKRMDLVDFDRQTGNLTVELCF